MGWLFWYHSRSWTCSWKTLSRSWTRSLRGGQRMGRGIFLLLCTLTRPAHPRGPSPAQPGRPKPGPGQISGNLGIQKNHKNKIIKIKIRSAQNVGKVWISRDKNPPGPIWDHFRSISPWTEKMHNKNDLFAYFQ